MPWLLRPLVLRTLWHEVRLAHRLVRDPAVPLTVRAVLPLALAYVVWPVDLLPDIVPLLGQLDDAAVAYGVLRLFLRLCPVEVASYHRAALARRAPFTPMPVRDPVIDAEYRRD